LCIADPKIPEIITPGMGANADRAYALMEDTETKQLLKGSETIGASPEMKAAAAGVRKTYSALKCHKL
jgi:hypothetical protein